MLTCAVHDAEHHVCSAQHNMLMQDSYIEMPRQLGEKSAVPNDGWRFLLEGASQQYVVMSSLTYKHDAAQDQHEDLQALLASLLGI